MDKVIELIKSKAKKDARFDDDEFVVDDYAGGNIDDAYSIGCEEGEIAFARELLMQLNNIPSK